MRYFTLGHMYRQVGIVSYYEQVVMEDSQFQKLMDEIKKFKCEVEGKLTSSIAELK